MPDTDPHNLSQRLTAFADGELDAAGNLAVLRLAADQPDVLARVEGERQLGAAARRVVRDGTPPAGEALRRRVALLGGDAAPAKVGAQPAAGFWAKHGGWLAAAAAVVLLVAGGLIGRFAPRAADPRDAGGFAVLPDAAQIVPAALARSITFTHVECSRLPADLHGRSVAEVTPGLVGPLEADLRRDAPWPDLSSVGYAFVGAGPCGHPVEDAVHLLYRSDDPAVRDTLSVFVRPFRQGEAAERDMKPGRLYEVVGPDQPHPMLAWRTGRLVYFLVGDAMVPVERARDVIRAEIRL